MDRRFEARKQEILEQAEVKPEVAHGMLKRLEQFAEPFVASLGRREAKRNARVYISGLLSDLGRKNVESIAYRHDQDRRGLQRFIGLAPWPHPLVLEMVKRRVLARTERSHVETPEELLVVTRSPDENGQMKYDYHLSNAPPDTPLKELAPLRIKQQK